MPMSSDALAAQQLTVPDHFQIPTDEISRCAFEASVAAARVLLKYYHDGVQMRAKECANLVSDADIDAERAIANVIRSRFPDHHILGEEELTASVDETHLWIVDPLDGTNNFAHKIPHFAVSVAYYFQGKPHCGVVVNPVRDDWYWAVAGQGAYHNGRRMNVSAEATLDQAMIGVGFYYDRGAMMEATLAAIGDFFRQQIHGVRRFGTAALDLCHVADGLYGVFFEYQLAPWDFAAGQLILQEAGGQVTDGRGRSLPLTRTSLLASNTLLHAAALSIVDKHHLPPAK